MAYRTVEESSLTGIADAIREAGGTEESLLFPDDFLTAISNLGGTGGTLTVNAPPLATVTVSKDGKTKTKVAGTDGVVVFKGLETGTWTVTITDGTQTASKTVEITADYATTINFFSATIHITYPAGSVCTATDGVTTLTDPDPDKSGVWDCVVPNAGTWTVSLDNGFTEDVAVNTDGETITLDKWYLYNAGDERDYITGGIISVKMITSGNYTIGTVTRNTDNIYLYADATPQQACIATANKVNTSGFQRLCARISNVKINTSGYRTLGLYSAYDAKNNMVASTFYDTAGVVSVDLSGDIPDCYVILFLNSQTGDTCKTTVHEIWLE